MNLMHVEYYERSHRDDLLREAEAERLARLARRTAPRRDRVVRPATPEPRVPGMLGRLLLRLRRATA